MENNEENMEKVLKVGNKVTRIIKIFLCAPILFIGVILILIGTIFTIKETKDAKGYLKTTANLIEVVPEENHETIYYTAKYSYEVNGTKYEIKPNRLSNKEGYKEKETVRYNKDNPSEAIISAHWGDLTIGGLTLTLFSVAFILGNGKLKLNKKIKQSSSV